MGGSRKSLYCLYPPIANILTRSDRGESVISADDRRRDGAAPAARGEEVRAEAQSDLDYGPLPLSITDINDYRYVLTEYMLDLKSPRSDGENGLRCTK